MRLAVKVHNGRGRFRFADFLLNEHAKGRIIEMRRELNHLNDRVGGSVREISTGTDLIIDLVVTASIDVEAYARMCANNIAVIPDFIKGMSVSRHDQSEDTTVYSRHGVRWNFVLGPNDIVSTAMIHYHRLI